GCGFLGRSFGGLFLGIRLEIHLDLFGDVDDEQLFVGDELDAGGQLDLSGEQVLTGGTALDGDLDEFGQLGRIGQDGDGRLLLRDHGPGSGFADDVHGHVDLDLLTALDDDQVEVLDLTAHGLDLHVTSDGQDVLGPVGAFDLEQRVGVLEREHGGVALERHVDGISAMTVDDRRDAARAADAARCALAELIASFGQKFEVSHFLPFVVNLSSSTTAKQPGSAANGVHRTRSVHRTSAASITETAVSLAEATRLFYGTVDDGTKSTRDGIGAGIDSGFGEQDVEVIRPLHVDDAQMRPLPRVVGDEFGRIEARLRGDEITF